jgi:hypothetical protein
MRTGPYAALLLTALHSSKSAGRIFDWSGDGMLAAHSNNAVLPTDYSYRSRPAFAADVTRGHLLAAMFFSALSNRRAIAFR